MTIHMTTSYQNSAHVTAKDAAALFAGMSGGQAYRLLPLNDTQNTYDPNSYDPQDFIIIDNNHIKVPAGQWLWNGRHIIITLPEELTVQSGAQAGVERVDRVCFHYTKDSNTNVETVELVVIEGEPSTGVATPKTGYNDFIGFTATGSDYYLTIAYIRIKGLSASFENASGCLPFLPTLGNVLTTSARDVSSLVSLVNPQYWAVRHLSAILHNNKTVTLNAHIIRQSFPLDNPQAWFTEQVFRLHDSIKCPQELHIPAVSNASNSNGLYGYIMNNTCGLRKIDGSVSLAVGGWVEFSATWNLN